MSAESDRITAGVIVGVWEQFAGTYATQVTKAVLADSLSKACLLIRELLVRVEELEKPKRTKGGG